MALQVSAKSLQGLKASLPAVAGAGTAVTEHFYKKLFTNYPSLKGTFNNTNQKAGKQPAALFGNVAMAATACVKDGGANIPPAILQLINHKHCALGVLPAQYDAVGETLLATIVDLLNPGQEVVDSWGELYGQVAKLYIALEEDLYQKSEVAGGWRGKRDFRIASVTQESTHVRSLVFEPVEAGAPLPVYQPGQYLTVWVHPEGWEYGQPRHYSLSDSPNGESFRISVKREGQVSDVLHAAQVGDVVQLSAPFGAFSCDFKGAEEVDIALLSAGIGATPILSMLKTLAKSDKAGSAKVKWYHAARDGSEHCFQEEVEAAGKSLSTFTSDVWYSSPKEEDAGKFNHEGRMDLSNHREALTAGNTQAYFCGPDAWMLDVRRQLTEWGVPAERVHFEHFGPQPLE